MPLALKAVENTPKGEHWFSYVQSFVDGPPPRGGRNAGATPAEPLHEVTHHVAVTFARPEDVPHFDDLLSSRLLQFYVGPFAVTRSMASNVATNANDGDMAPGVTNAADMSSNQPNRSRLPLPKYDSILRKLHVLAIIVIDGAIETVVVETSVERVESTGQVAHLHPFGPGVGSITSLRAAGARVSTTLLSLKCPSAAVLVVFRSSPGDAGSGSNARPNEYVVLVQHNRRGVSQAYQDLSEVPCGRFDANNRIASPSIALVERAFDIEIVRHDLTPLANRPGGNVGMSSAPGFLNDNIELYLFRMSVSEADISRFQKQLATESSRQNDPGSIIVKLIPLGSAWRSSTDLKTLSALFLFHEYRYHSFMPAYTAPTGSARKPGANVSGAGPNAGGASTTGGHSGGPGVMQVRSLRPESRRVNLNVKVVTAISKATMSSVTQGEMVIGDRSGIVTALISGELCDLDYFELEGTRLRIRDAQVEMLNSRIHLRLNDGRQISAVPLGDEEEDYVVNQNNDVSVQTYELVPQEVVAPRERQADRVNRGQTDAAPRRRADPATEREMPSGALRGGRGGGPLGEGRGRGGAGARGRGRLPLFVNPHNMATRGGRGGGEGSAGGPRMAGYPTERPTYA